MDIEGAVTQDVESAATEPTSSPEPTEPAVSPQPSEPQARTGTENAIPHWRVEEMRRKDAQKHAAELAEVRKQLEQYGSVINKVNDGFSAFGRGLGFIKDEPPKYVDEKTYQEQINSLKSELSEKFQQDLAVRELASSWKQVSAKHSKWTTVPGFKQACLEEYSNTGRDLGEIADDFAGRYAKMFAAVKAEEAAAKEAEVAKTKVVKPGGGSGAPVEKGAKGSIASQVMARLKDRSA